MHLGFSRDEGRNDWMGYIPRAKTVSLRDKGGVFVYRLHIHNLKNLSPRVKLRRKFGEKAVLGSLVSLSSRTRREEIVACSSIIGGWWLNFGSRSMIDDRFARIGGMGAGGLGESETAVLHSPVAYVES